MNKNEHIKNAKEQYESEQMIFPMLFKDFCEKEGWGKESEDIAAQKLFEGLSQILGKIKPFSYEQMQIILENVTVEKICEYGDFDPNSITEYAFNQSIDFGNATKECLSELIEYMCEEIYPLGFEYGFAGDIVTEFFGIDRIINKLRQ